MASENFGVFSNTSEITGEMTPCLLLTRQTALFQKKWPVLLWSLFSKLFYTKVAFLASELNTWHTTISIQSILPFKCQLKHQLL